MKHFKNRLQSQISFAAILLLFIVSYSHRAQAQPFATAGYGVDDNTGYNGTNPGCTDVHGESNGSNTHHQVGQFYNSGTSSADILYIRKDATGGSVNDVLTIDLGTSTADQAGRMTVDDVNHKAYITATGGSSGNGKLVCVDISGIPATIDWVVSVGNSTSSARDVTLDPNGDLYVTGFQYVSGNEELFVEKYDNTGSMIGTPFNSSTISAIGVWGLDWPRLKYNTSTNELYICGNAATANGCIVSLSSSLSYNGLMTCGHVLYVDVDIDPTTGYVVGLGEDVSTINANRAGNICWDVYDPSMLTLVNSGTSSQTYGDFPYALLIDPAGTFIITSQMGYTGVPYTVTYWATYINMMLGTFGDVDYGPSAYQITTSQYNNPFGLHKDDIGKIVVGCSDPISSPQHLMTISLSGASGPWSGYENKQTAIRNVERSGPFSLYPNPAKNSINITLDQKSAANYSYAITNALGQVQATGAVDKSLEKLNCNISQFAPGTYYVQLLCNNKPVGMRSFVKY